jgi:hypothetical protein
MTTQFVRATNECGYNPKFLQSDSLADFTSKDSKKNLAGVGTGWRGFDAAKGKYVGFYGNSKDKSTGYVLVLDIVEVYSYFSGPVLIAIVDSIDSTNIKGTVWSNPSTPLTKTIGAVEPLLTFSSDSNFPSATGVPVLYAALPSGSISWTTATATVPSVGSYTPGSNKAPSFVHNATASNTLTADPNVPYVTIINTGLSTFAIIMIILLILVLLVVIVGGAYAYKHRVRLGYAKA